MHVVAKVSMTSGETQAWLLAESNRIPPHDRMRSRQSLRWVTGFNRRIRRTLMSIAGRVNLVSSGPSDRLLANTRESAERNIRDAKNPLDAAGAFSGAGHKAPLALAGATIMSLPVAGYGAILVILGISACAVSFAMGAGVAIAVRVPIVSSRARALAARLAAGLSPTRAGRDVATAPGGTPDTARRDLEWLAARCDRVVVVGDREGAAVALATLLGDALPPVAALVTIGAPLESVTDHGRRDPVSRWRAVRPDMRWRNVWSEWDPLTEGLVVDRPQDRTHRLTAVYANERRAGRFPDGETVDFLVSAIPGVLPDSLAGPVASGIEVAGNAAADPEPAATSSNPQADHATRASSSAANDVVTQGLNAILSGAAMYFTSMAGVAVSVIPKVEREAPRAVDGPEEVVVHNRASLFRDHWQYHMNIPQVIGQIASVAADVAGWGDVWGGAAYGDIDRRATRSHVTAVRLLAISRFISGLTAITAAGVVVSSGYVGGVPASAGVFLVVAAGSYAALYGVEVLTWRKWRQAETTYRFFGGSGEFVYMLAVVFLAELGAAIVLSAVTADGLLRRVIPAGDAFVVTVWLGLFEVGIAAWSRAGRRPNDVGVPTGPVVREADPVGGADLGRVS